MVSILWKDMVGRGRWWQQTSESVVSHMIPVAILHTVLSVGSYRETVLCIVWTHHLSVQTTYGLQESVK